MVGDGEEDKGVDSLGPESMLARFLTMKGWLEWGRKLGQCRESTLKRFLIEERR